MNLVTSTSYSNGSHDVSNDVSKLDFSKLLQEGGLELKKPASFTQRVVHYDTTFPYEYVLRHNNDLMEIRYSIRPIDRVKIEYQDPHNSAPQPNYLFNMMFESIITQLASTGFNPRREYPVEQSSSRFNAGWAAAAVVDVSTQYSTMFRHALLLALHKDDLADAYVVFLYNDYQKIKQLLDKELSTLRFVQ
ncbi:MAG: hypothetical protein ACC653_12645 [Gammaproteobacteria bacterium]